MELLRALLERASVNLLYLTATFLKKLSVRTKLDCSSHLSRCRSVPCWCALTLPHQSER